MCSSYILCKCPEEAVNKKKNKTIFLRSDNQWVNGKTRTCNNCVLWPAPGLPPTKSREPKKQEKNLVSEICCKIHYIINTLAQAYPYYSYTSLKIWDLKIITNYGVVILKDFVRNRKVPHGIQNWLQWSLV